MLKINVRNKTNDKKIESIFSKKLQYNLQLGHETQEQLVINTVKDTIHHWKCKKQLETYRKVREEDCCIPCTYCFKQLTKTQYKRKLVCNHTFHKKCIDRWIFVHNNDTCPICKCSIFKCTN